ncbi:unnamed protein product [Paramecium primaurelia]|uniref:VLIG-type G domain-containing protein n=1 Tax=Paramecium primaurelia TaxID=5886 RepID=A0A8S1MGH9_PARPR|nr:unnamed protein product [Paramecium primaurelia]
MFQNCIQKVQFKEISVQQGKDILYQNCKDQQIFFLFELFTIKLGSHFDNLLGFMKNLLYVKNKEINKDDLISYISLTENFNQNLDFLYFKLVFYFWIQYIEQFKLKDKIQEIEQKLQKISQFKQQVCENSIQYISSQNKNLIFRYVLQKIVFYSNLQDQDFKEGYKQQEDYEIEFKNKCDQFKFQNLELQESNLNEVVNISKKIMFYQLITQQNQCQGFNKQIHILKFLATNDLSDKLKQIFLQIITKGCEDKQIDDFSKIQKINLLHLQNGLENKSQIKMSRFVNQNEIFQQYPKQMRIKMEEFNISLTSKNNKEDIIQEWLKDKTNENNFKKLLPYYFNIIKRRESPEDLLSFINSQDGRKNESLNLKSLFQLLYNNSDKELQVMLLKLHSKSYPVPLLYQNPQLEKNFTSNKDFYILNSNMFYLLSNDFPIINFSLSKIVNQFGKSELINMIFYAEYEDSKFEVSDKSLINNSSIDCQFDFSFNGSRNYLIADVHGQLEDEIYQALLPFFQFWIIQMQSDDEFEENVDKLMELYEKMEFKINPKIVLIIRDSEQKQLNQEKLNMIQQKGIDVYQIPNLQRQENKAEEKEERKKIKEFIIKKIDNKNETVKEEEIQESFLNICKAFNVNEDEIKQSQKILTDLTFELEKIIKQEDGFYSIQAFPLRNLAWRLKSLKKQRQQLNYTKNSYEQELEKKQNAIIQIKCDKNSDKQGRLDQKKKEKQEIEQKIKQTEENLILITKEIDNFEEKNTQHNFNESLLIKYFSQIFEQNHFYITYISFVEKIAKFNSRNLKDLNLKIEKVKEQLKSIKEEQEIQILEKSLKNLENKYTTQNISIELFWREVIKGNSSFLQSPIVIVCQLIKKGEPFEFLNGDDLSIDSNFLHQLRENLLDKGDNKILFLSILGPQSSGKSTLLNRIFGCHFLTSMGRCTKGLFLQLLKISNKEQFDNLFDYILLLDSEGLQNPHQQDPEFDKKITLFIIQISDILIFNVKGEIHSTFHNLIEASFYTLAKYSKLKFLKQFSWCFNQNSQLNENEKFKLLNQIEDIGKNLDAEKSLVDEDNNQIKYVEHLDIHEDNIQILGMATISKEWQKYYSQSQNDSIQYQEINQQDYSKNALKFGIKIIEKYIQKYKKTKNNHHQILTWDAFINKVESCWEIVSKLPDLVEFSDLKEQKDYETINKIATEKMTKANEKFPDFDYIIQLIQEKSESNNSLENYNSIQKDVQDGFLQSCYNQKDEILKDLQKEYSYQIISDAIIKKVEGNIAEVYYAIGLEGSLIILQKIHQLRRQFQYSLVSAKFEQIVSELLNNQGQLKKLQENLNLRNNKFEQLWNEQVESSNKEIENLHIEFQKALFVCFQKYKIQYQFKSENLEDQIDYFIKVINKQEPNEKKESQMEKICSLFLKDFQKKNSFNTLNKQSKQQYQQIFEEDIQKRLDNMPKSPLIDPWKYLQKQINYQVIKKSQIVDEVKNNLKSVLIEIIKQKKDEEKQKLEIQELFTILNQLPIQFEKKILENVLNLVKRKFLNFKQILYGTYKQSTQQPEIQQNPQPTQSQTKFPIFQNKIECFDPKNFYSNVQYYQQTSISFQQICQNIPNSFSYHNNLGIQRITSNQNPNSNILNFQNQYIFQNTQNIQRKDIQPFNQINESLIIDNLVNSLQESQAKSQPMNIFIFKQIQQKFPQLIGYQKNLTDMDEKLKNQYFILKEHVSIKFSQSYKRPLYQHLFNYIISQKNNQMDIQDFSEYFPSLFIEIMNENQGWIKLCSNIYNIIQDQIYDSKQSQPKQSYSGSDIWQIISMDEDVTQYSRQLLQGLIQKVENKLESINKELAFFGIEFSQLLIRKLQFFAFFIIWRFICYDKLKMYEKEQNKFLENKAIMKCKYENAIKQNQLQDCKDQAIQQAKLIYRLCISQFYKENNGNVTKQIKQKQMTSYQLIKDLDQQLLIIKKEDIIQGQSLEESIIEYLSKQIGFLNKYIGQFIQNLQKEIEKQLELQPYVQNQLNLIKNNTSILLDRITNFQKLQPQDQNFGFENQKLSSYLILYYILGYNIGNIEQLKYKQIFLPDQNIKEVILPMEEIQKNQMGINMLYLSEFLKEFISQISIFYEQSQTLKTSIDEFQLKGKFQEMKNIMNGCDQSCPTCNRKCDSEDFLDKNHKHKCKNGHQLRGMNKILIRNSPSLFTCEEIVDETEILIKETSKIKTWKEIKAYYKNWSFKDILLTEQLQQNKQKMIEIWNGGIGQKICDELSKELKQRVLYLKKYDLTMYQQHSSTHYIFILDDSGSMKDQWNSVIKSIETQFQQISKKENARVSVVIFNNDARVVIKCQELKIQEQLKLITYMSGGTKYGPAFKQTFLLLKEYPEFNNSIILFYTDGLAEYPQKEIEEFSKLQKTIKDTIYFLACSLPNKSISLDQILNFCQREFSYAEWREKIEPSNLNKNWTEMISQTNFDKYKA